MPAQKVLVNSKKVQEWSITKAVQESSVLNQNLVTKRAINRPSFTNRFILSTFKMLSLQNAIMRAKNFYLSS